MPFFPLDYWSSTDSNDQQNIRVNPPPSATSPSTSSSTYQNLQTGLTISGFATVLVFTSILVSYIAFRGRQSRKLRERISLSQQPLSNRNKDFDVEFNILVNGHGPTSPGRVGALHRRTGSHHGGGRNGGHNYSFQTQEGVTGREHVSRARIARHNLESNPPPNFDPGEIVFDPHLLRRTAQMKRMNLHMRDLGEYIHGGDRDSQGSLPKYEIGAPPPAYFKG